MMLPNSLSVWLITLLKFFDPRPRLGMMFSDGKALNDEHIARCLPLYIAFYATLVKSFDKVTKAN